MDVHSVEQPPAFGRSLLTTGPVIVPDEPQGESPPLDDPPV
jgi:hypothetical protein